MPALEGFLLAASHTTYLPDRFPTKLVMELLRLLFSVLAKGTPFTWDTHGPYPAGR